MYCHLLLTQALIMDTFFIWGVRDSGYLIEDRPWEENEVWDNELCRFGEPGTVTPRLIRAPGGTSTIYSPLKEYTGLFRTFAGLNGRDDILRFANKYGLIGTEDFKDLRFAGETREEYISPESGYSGYFELLTTWHFEIRYLREAVILWDALQNGNHDFLNQVIRWKRNPKRAFYEGAEPHFGDIPIIHPDGSPIKFGETVWPAWLFIQGRINTSFSHRMEADMRWNDDNELKLTLEPKTLLGAMWLQFADAVTYNLEYRDCAWCGRSFEVTRSTRSDRQYCSNSCRVSASRKRTSSAKRKQP
jgi:hypothetical protein